MPETSPEIRSLRARLGAHESWARTVDRPARTANARRAFEDKFLKEADGDELRAESLRKAFFTRMALKSAQSRRRGGADAVENLDHLVHDHLGGVIAAQNRRRGGDDAA